jgi:uncharacterized surface protein with fasciclin (FAS1) repeats
MTGYNAVIYLHSGADFMKKFIVAAFAATTLCGLSAGAVAGSYDKKAAKADIVDTAVAAGSFKTLAAALGAADLVGTLKGKGPFTVFAPTDAAFAKLPAGTVEMLLKPENKAKLASILTYHVVPGKVTSKQLIGKKLSPTTVQGTTVDVDATHSGVKVDGATVTKADIMTSNGVIHVIDTVIMP